MIGDYAVTGCGLGAYEPTFVRYQTVAPMSTVNFAHNDHLPALAEVGGVGFALVMAAWVLGWGTGVSGQADSAAPAGRGRGAFSGACELADRGPQVF